MNQSDQETMIWLLVIAFIILLWLYFRKKPVMPPAPPLTPGGGSPVNVTITNPGVGNPGRCGCA